MTYAISVRPASCPSAHRQEPDSFFVVAIVAWVGIELLRFQRRAPVAAGEKVRIAARRIGKSGEVLGLDDASGAPTSGTVDVTLKVKDVQGKVVGVRRGPRRP